MRQPLTFIALLAGAGLLGAQTGGPKTFSSPEEARDALVQAASQGMGPLREMMGIGAAEILGTGDAVQDKALIEQFQKRVAEKISLEPDPMNPGRVTVDIGNEEWPFAVPIVRKNGLWYFDAQEGKAELRRRIIGANELDALEVCRGYVEAQEMYGATDWDNNGILQYATRFASTPGKKDGLYWPGDDSPISEAIAKALAEGYTGAAVKSGGYHGYYYKILLAQGPDAAGGAEDYVVHGFMIGGFALVAWPVEYGVSGIMTFMVNQDGVVYEKDLGRQTGTLAKAMTKFNPDKSWSVSPEIDLSN